MKLVNQKHVTTAVLRDAGLPAPGNYVVSNDKAARQAAEQIGWPVVIKPTDLERGEGVTVDVQPETLDEAFAQALALSPKKMVLVEEQASGVCHRLFIQSGQLLYAVKRLPIGVYGDGELSVRELVQAAYDEDLQKPDWDRSKILPVDDLARVTLAAEGLSEDTVPKKGRFVPLRRIESTASGGVDEDVTDLVHPENLRVAIAATRLFGMSVAGIDIITEDISKPWHDTGAIINEVNFSPLLGGGDISRKHLDTYVERVLGGSGLIPVDVFVGGKAAMEAAQRHVKDLDAKGAQAFLTNDDITQDASGTEVPMNAKNLAQRVRALIFSRNVEAIAIVVQTDSLLDGPLPLEFVDAVHIVEDLNLTNKTRAAQLTGILSKWVRVDA